MKQLRPLAAALLPVAFAAIAPSASAQVTWTQSPVNGHWYTLVLGTGTWCDQETIAQSYGGHLATVRDPQEQNWIVQTFGQSQSPLDIAIGGNDVAVQGTYVWASGEPFTLPPNNPSPPAWNPWASGEPNHLGGVERHAYMNGVIGFLWVDACGCCGPGVGHWGLVELISDDCDQNAIPDKYELLTGAVPDCNSNGVPDSCDIAAGTSLDPNGNGIPEECESSITTYCSPAAPNSVSANGSHLSVQGTPSTILNNLVFTVSSLPPNKPGLFIYGPFQNHLPAGNGFVCIGGFVQRVQPGLISTPQGTVTLPVNLSQFPFTGGTNTVLPGSTWNFQFWHRDPFGGLYGFNFSDAGKLTFAP